MVVDAPKESASRVNAVLAEQKLFLSELVTRSVSLEEVFLQMTGGEKGE